MEVCGDLHTPVAVLPRKEPPVPIEWDAWSTTEPLRALCTKEIYRILPLLRIEM